MTDECRLSLAAGVTMEATVASIVFVGGGRRFQLRDPSPGLAAALATLATDGGTRAALARRISEADGIAGLARFHHCALQLQRRGLLIESVTQDARLLASLEVRAAGYTPADPGPGTRFRLSRFAYLRRIDEDLAVETPLGHARVRLLGPRAVAALHALARPCTADEVHRQVEGLDQAACAALLGLLTRAGMVASIDAAGDPACDSGETLRTWEFHDLLFHARSRLGRHDGAVGASFRLADVSASPPAFRTPHAGEHIALARPDLADALHSDPPFAAVVEGRRSVRHYGQPAIDARQLGDFLYRVAAVRETLSGAFDAPGGAIDGEFSVRPYPSGGSLYELEIYPAIARAANLPRGLCHYDARSHGLVRLATDEARLDALIADTASRAGVAADEAQVVLLITARFARVAWKYESMAYALVLKHVGVLFETMYLTASALRLAPCAIGSGNSDLFASASGIDYFAEGLVGEFLLGTAPAV